MQWPDDFINKIIQGDCLEVMKQMPDKCVDLVLTDPPDGLDYQGNGGKKTGNLKDKIANDKPDEFVEIIKKVIPELIRVTKDNSEIYWFCGGGGGEPVLAYAWLEFKKFEPKLKVKN